MDRNQLKKYVILCKEAGISSEAMLRALEKKAAIPGWELAKKIIGGSAKGGAKAVKSVGKTDNLAKLHPKSLWDKYGPNPIERTSEIVARRGANVAKTVGGIGTVGSGVVGYNLASRETDTSHKSSDVSAPLTEGGSAALENRKREASKALGEVGELTSDIKQSLKNQKDWMLRGGLAGGGLGALIAPLLAEKNPGLASVVGGTTGAVLGGVGGAMLSDTLQKNYGDYF